MSTPRLTRSSRVLSAALTMLLLSVSVAFAAPPQEIPVNQDITVPAEGTGCGFSVAWHMEGSIKTMDPNNELASRVIKLDGTLTNLNTGTTLSLMMRDPEQMIENPDGSMTEVTHGVSIVSVPGEGPVARDMGKMVVTYPVDPTLPPSIEFAAGPNHTYGPFPAICPYLQ